MTAPGENVNGLGIVVEAPLRQDCVSDDRSRMLSAIQHHAGQVSDFLQPQMNVIS